jgi:hypothetical protein
MKLNISAILTSFIILFISCSEDQDAKVSGEENFILEESIPTKSDTQKTYKITTESGVVYDDLSLTTEQVKMIRNSSGIGSPVEVNATGYDSWTLRGGGRSYKLFINGYNNHVPSAVYLVRDIFIFKTVKIPTPLAIAYTPNEYEPTTDRYLIGWNPNALNTIGLTAAIGGDNFHMQTAAIRIDHTIIGQEVGMTWVCHAPILEWRAYYIPFI